MDIEEFHKSLQDARFVKLREETKKMLPIGSVVVLLGSKEKYMICGRKQKDENGEVYDYYGCPFPHGMTIEEDGVLFDAGNIVMVLFLGYQDLSEIHERFVLLQAKLDEAEEGDET
jgi:hypothetical protein